MIKIQGSLTFLVGAIIEKKMHARHYGWKICTKHFDSNGLTWQKAETGNWKITHKKTQTKFNVFVITDYDQILKHTSLTMNSSKRTFSSALETDMMSCDRNNKNKFNYLKYMICFYKHSKALTMSFQAIKGKLPKVERCKEKSKSSNAPLKCPPFLHWFPSWTWCTDSCFYFYYCFDAYTLG